MFLKLIKIGYMLGMG